MGWILFLLFVGLPIAEIAVLIQAGDWIGLWPTIGLVILTAAAGAALARAEGRAAMARLAASVDDGSTPIGPLLDAAAIFVGAILLLTPGFITDTLGLSLLFRPTRFLWGQAMAWLQRGRRPRRGPGEGPGPGGHAHMRGRTVVIEGDYEESASAADAPADRTPPDEAPEQASDKPERRIDR